MVFWVAIVLCSVVVVGCDEKQVERVKEDARLAVGCLSVARRVLKETPKTSTEFIAKISPSTRSKPTFSSASSNSLPQRLDKSTHSMPKPLIPEPH